MLGREIRFAALCASTLLLLAGLMSGTGAARGVGSTPRLLAADPGTEFVVRPATLSFDETWHGHRADFMGARA